MPKNERARDETFPILWFNVSFNFFFGNYEAQIERVSLFSNVYMVDTTSRRKNNIFPGIVESEANVYMLSKHLHKSSIKAYTRSADKCG